MDFGMASCIQTPTLDEFGMHDIIIIINIVTNIIIIEIFITIMVIIFIVIRLVFFVVIFIVLVIITITLNTIIVIITIKTILSTSPSLASKQVDGAWSWTRRFTAMPQNVKYGWFW